MDLVRKILREAALFCACAIFVAGVGLIIMDQIVMPRYVRQRRGSNRARSQRADTRAGTGAVAGRGPAHERTRTAMGCVHARGGKSRGKTRPRCRTSSPIARSMSRRVWASVCTPCRIFATGPCDRRGCGSPEQNWRLAMSPRWPRQRSRRAISSSRRPKPESKSSTGRRSRSPVSTGPHRAFCRHARGGGTQIGRRTAFVVLPRPARRQYPLRI